MTEVILKLATPLGLAQAHCADRFRATGNHAWLIPWAITRPPFRLLYAWAARWAWRA